MSNSFLFILYNIIKALFLLKPFIKAKNFKVLRYVKNLMQDFLSLLYMFKMQKAGYK